MKSHQSLIHSVAKGNGTYSNVGPLVVRGNDGKKYLLSISMSFLADDVFCVELMLGEGGHGAEQQLI